MDCQKLSHPQAYVTVAGNRLLRLAGIRRRSQGDPFRFIDTVSDLRQEFSFSARRIIVAAVYILIVVHWFACILWWTIMLQNYPAGKSVGNPIKAHADQ